MGKNDKHCRKCDSSNTIVLEARSKGKCGECHSSSSSDLSALDSCSSSSSSSYRYESNFSYLAKDKKCNSECSSSSSSCSSSSSSSDCGVCSSDSSSSSSTHSLTSSCDKLDYKDSKRSGKRHHKKHDKKHDKKKHNKKDSRVRRNYNDFDFEVQKKTYSRTKEFNITFRKFNQHRYAKHVKNNGQAIFIENYMCPNLHLNVGDRLVFKVVQDGKKENNFVLTESPISNAYGNTVLPLPGFTPVKEGTVEYIVTENTPKVFHYCSSISAAFGGNIKIRN